MNNHTVNYVYPPDFKKAYQHRLANRIFKGNFKPDSQQCECCGKKIGEQTVQTNCSIEPKQLSFLGPGIPLFFLFLKYIILLLLIMTVLFMGFSMISNITSNDCGTISSCIPDAFNSLSLINKKSKNIFMEVQTYLGLVFVVASILFFHYFRYKARILQQQCDEVIDSPSDYALILRRLPPDITEKDIREFINQRKSQLTPEELARSSDLQINNIILSYSLNQYVKTQQQNIKNFKTCVKEERVQQFKAEDLPTPTKTSQIAVVVFESQAAKDCFFYKPTTYQKILQFFCTPCIPLSPLQIKGEKIGIQRAPQPDDIFWENSGITMKGAICRKITTGVISILILFVGGGAQYGLSLLANTVSGSTKTIINVISSIIVTIFNVVLMLVLGILTKKERNQTLTEYQTVLMVKITLFQFLNAGIFVVLSEIAANLSSFTLSDGFVSQVTMIMILNAIVPNITLFSLDYSEIINRALRYCVEKQWLIYTQKELNELFIGSTIQIPNKYAYILKTLWLTALYAPLIPIVIGVSMIGLLLFYFVEKILYTRSYSMPNTVSSMSYESAIELLQYFLITFSLGQLVIYYYFYNFQYNSIPILWTITILATISLSVLNSALPMEAINAYFFKIQDSSHSELKYSDVEQKFQVTYEMTNPAYKSQRQRKNIKDFISISNKQDSKTVAIELTNMFNDAVNKNTESLQSQKPMLSDLVDNKTSMLDQSNIIMINGNPEKKGDSRKSPTVRGEAIQNKRKESGTKTESKNEKEDEKDIKIQNENEKEREKDKQNDKINKHKKGHKTKGKDKSKDKTKNIDNNSEYDKHEGNENDKQKLKQSKHKNNEKSVKFQDEHDSYDEEDQSQSGKSGSSDNSDNQSDSQQSEQIKQLPKKWRQEQPPPPRRRIIRKAAPIQINQIQIVDPFADITGFTPARFVLKWKKEQQEISRLQAIKQKEREKNKEMKELTLPKLTQQSNLKAPLMSPSSNHLEENLENIYSDILTRPQALARNQSKIQIKPNSFFVETAPISSKYHLSNGKQNIFQEFIDLKHPIVYHFKKSMKDMTRKEKKPKPKPQIVENEEKNEKKGKGGKGGKADKSKKKGQQEKVAPQINEEYHRPRESKFKYLNVKEVPIKPKRKMRDQGTSEGEQMSIPTLFNKAVLSKSMSLLQNDKPNKELDDAYNDTFGKNSHKNSKSSLGFEANSQQMARYKKNEHQFKDEKKQQMATYNPIMIPGSYKSYFTNKGGDSDIQGFLYKKDVMNYIGTPFSNLVKREEMPKTPK